jgi:hypothetical protein
MSAYKQFLTSDIIVTPFKVSKAFSFEGGNALTGSNVSVDRFLGKNIESNPFISGSNPTTGYISTEDQELIYNSVKELYYSNYISSSYGDKPQTSSLVPGVNSEGDRSTGNNQSSGRYFNYPQTDVTFQRFFPTGSNEVIGVISIPSRLFGDYILPNSFEFSSESGSVYDDGEGNLILSSSGEICGNIFYPHGIITLTSQSATSGGGGYGSGTYGGSEYGGSEGGSSFIENFIESSNVTCSFSSSYDIYETQYKCTARDNEFNFSLNPSLIVNETTGSVLGFVTESYFTPYVTTVGLYSDDQELLAVGKLSQPLPLSVTTDTTILINIDR